MKEIKTLTYKGNTTVERAVFDEDVNRHLAGDWKVYSITVTAAANDYGKDIYLVAILYWG